MGMRMEEKSRKNKVTIVQIRYLSHEGLNEQLKRKGEMIILSTSLLLLWSFCEFHRHLLTCIMG